MPARALAIAALLALLAPFASATHLNAYAFHVFLEGAQEVPPVQTRSLGAALVLLSNATNEVTVRMAHNIGELQAAHIHQGAAGTNGPVIVTLVGSPTTAQQSTVTATNLTDATVEAIFAGDAYLNLHTAANPGGELRGQLLPARSFDANATAFAGAFAAELKGANQVPPVATDSIGFAYAAYNPSTMALAVEIKTNLPRFAASHIHRGNSTSNGPVIVALSDAVEGGSLSTTATIAPDVLADLQSGNAYFNVHTATNPNGELRAQVQPIYAALGLPMPTPAQATTGAAPTSTSRPSGAGKVGMGAGMAAAVGMVAAAALF